MMLSFHVHRLKNWRMFFMAVRKSVRILLERQCFIKMVLFTINSEVIESITKIDNNHATTFDKVALDTII